METMGMTDKQFNGFIRFLIDDLKEAEEETDVEKKNARIKKVLENLQSTLEDQTRERGAFYSISFLCSFSAFVLYTIILPCKRF